MRVCYLIETLFLLCRPWKTTKSWHRCLWYLSIFMPCTKCRRGVGNHPRDFDEYLWWVLPGTTAAW